MRRTALATVLSAAVAFALAGSPSGYAADPELDVYNCSGSVPEGALSDASMSSTGASISCTSDQAPSFSADATIDTSNTPVGPGVYLTQGALHFAVAGDPWVLYFLDQHVTTNGVMSFETGTSGVELADDYVGPSGGGEHKYHIRVGKIEDHDCVDRLIPAINTGCDHVAEFSFVAEWLHDLPIG
jgi:hypothetical protein